MEEGKVYFLLGMRPEEFVLIYSVARQMGRSFEEFIFDALREYVMKIQSERLRSQSPQQGIQEGG